MKKPAWEKPPRSIECAFCRQQHDRHVIIVKQGDSLRSVSRRRIRADRLQKWLRPIFWESFKTIRHVHGFQHNGCRYYMDFTETLICPNTRVRDGRHIELV